MLDPDILWNAALDLKTAIEDAFASYAVELPVRRFIYGGDLEAFDCAQLAISARFVANGQAGRGGAQFVQRNGPRLRVATLRATLMRCSPVPDSRGQITTETLEATGRIMLRDRWVLYNGVFKQWLDGAFLGSCQQAAFTSSEAVGEQGALIGSTLNVEAQL